VQNDIRTTRVVVHGRPDYPRGIIVHCKSSYPCGIIVHCRSDYPRGLYHFYVVTTGYSDVYGTAVHKISCFGRTQEGRFGYDGCGGWEVEEL
jgi:hypothetical protein